jgi:hypothetical protein
MTTNEITPAKTRAQKLADALLADKQRDDTTGTTTSCRMCGYGMMRRHSGANFCSDRCAQYHADGFPVPEPAHIRDRKAFELPLRSWSAVAGPPDVKIGASYYGAVFDARNSKFTHPRDGHRKMKMTDNGFKIDCVACGTEFESLGQRCCSKSCESEYRSLTRRDVVEAAA